MAVICSISRDHLGQPNSSYRRFPTQTLQTSPSAKRGPEEEEQTSPREPGAGSPPRPGRARGRGREAVTARPPGAGPQPPPGLARRRARTAPAPCLAQPARTPAARRHLAAPCGRARSPRAAGRRTRAGGRAGASHGPGRDSRALPLCPARHRLRSLQDGLRGGAESLQPFPLPARGPRPLAGRSPRRKGRQRRKRAGLRMRTCVLELRDRITPVQRLLSPRDWSTSQWRRALLVAKETPSGKMAAAGQGSPNSSLPRRDPPRRPPRDGNGCRPGPGLRARWEGDARVPAGSPGGARVSRP